MKYLITGITGFAGSNLAKLLINEGHEVWGTYNNTRPEILKLILTDEEFKKITFRCRSLSMSKHFIQREQFDGIFHLAAQAHPGTGFTNPILTFDTNVMGSLYLLDSIQKYSPNTIVQYCSTSEVYGDSYSLLNRPVNENDKLIPNNPYATSKAAIDLHMQERMKGGFIKGMITRAFSHTGPMRGRFFSISSDAYQLAMMILNKQEKILKVGNLKSRRAVMDVRDCVNVYYLLMKNNESQGNVYNICGTKVYSMKYYTDKLIEISGLKDVKQEIEPKFYRPVDINIQQGDNFKINNLLNLDKMEKIPLEKTLSDLLNYWIRRIEKYGCA